MSLITSCNFNKYVPIYFGLLNKNQHWKLGKYLQFSILNKIHLIGPQIDCLHDVINWEELSKTHIPDYLIIKYKNLINWEIFLQNKHPKGIIFLSQVKDKVIEQYSLFFKNEMKKIYYTSHFIQVFPELIDWKWLVTNLKLNEYILLKYWDKFSSDDISKYQNITRNIFEKKKIFINWVEVSMRSLSDKFIEMAHEYLIWNLLCKYQKFSRKILNNYMEKFTSREHWDTISQYQKLSNKFIRKKYKKLNMFLVSRYQNMNMDTIMELSSYINFDNLLNNKWYNTPNSIQIFKNHNKFFILCPSLLGYQTVNYYEPQYINLDI